MGKKIFCSLVSLIMIMSLVACGNNDSVITDSTPVQAAPAVTEKPAPEPEPEPEPEVVTEEIVEEPTPEPTEEPTPEPAEPTEEEIVAEVLANDEYYEDGAFCPKLYAEAIGYKWYGDYDGEVDMSFVSDGIEYFTFFLTSSSSCNIIYTDGEACYGFTLFDVDESDRSLTQEMNIGNKVSSYSDLYVKNVVLLLNSITRDGAEDMNTWEFEGLTYGFNKYDCQMAYWDDGFGDSSKLTNKDEAVSFKRSYKD